ncbi:unnamed protein product [Heterobilharzia americana]|nr:unnamed protein product [Heterobilharzia americana]
MKASSSESCSGSLNTSLLGSQETSKHNYRENNLLRNQITLIRNNLKLLKSQVDFLIKFRSTETGGLVQQVRETLKNELESLLNWLEPIKSEDTILKRNRTLRRSPRLIERQKIKSPETSFKIPEKLSPTSLSELIEISNFVQEDGSKKKEDNFNEYNNLNVFMQKMENDFDYLTNEFKLLQKRVEAFEQLNWQELFNNFRVKIQEQTIKLCISYIIRDLDQDIFEA